MRVKSSWKYEGFCAEGEGLLCISDMDDNKDSHRLTDPRGITFEIEEGVTEVEEGFFDMFPYLTRIILPNSMKRVNVSEKTREIFHRCGVLICGNFDSYAETFAKEQGLTFMHKDIELARAGDYSDHGVDVVTLRFLVSGAVILKQESFCPGISAGNNGGGETSDQLKANFYKTMSRGDIADMCWGTVSGKVRKSAELEKFLKKAIAKGGYCLSFGDKK